MTLSTRPDVITASAPWATNAAPTTPPISACDEDDGRPQYQVARFQAIAPTSPANTIAGVMRSAFTMPLAIVAATASEMKAPTKLSAAASVTARRGGRGRGEIDVAAAVAGAWEAVGEADGRGGAATNPRAETW